MSGITSLILTDKEVDVLLRWAELAEVYDVLGAGSKTERSLFVRLQELRSKLACDGENCKI